MSPVPVDPFADFLVGAVANPDQVDARFLELYKTLDPARNGIDWTNVRTGGLQDLVTSLPASPRDGQECHFLADATAGVVWHLRYRAASASAYKWEFVGGSPLAGVVDTSQGTSATAYTNPATAGPDVTVPLAGEYDYDVSVQAFGAGVTNAAVGVSVGGAAPGAADQMIASVTSGTYGAIAFGRRQPAVAAGTLFRVQYASTAGLLVTWINRRLRVRPVRVG